MDEFRLPLEHFTHVKEMPKPLTSELQALWLLHAEPNTMRFLVWAERSDPFIYIERHFRSGNTTKSYVVLDGDLADTLRLLTSREDGGQVIRSLNRVGSERYQELVTDMAHDIARPALREAGIRGPFVRPQAVLEAAAPALAMPHRQIIYLQAPTKLRLETATGEGWFVTIDGKVMNPPATVP